jgi:hypothetical protein
MMSWMRYETGMNNAELTEMYGQYPDRWFSDTGDADALAAARLGILDGAVRPENGSPGVFGTDVTFDRESAAIMLMRVRGIIGGCTDDESDFGFVDIEDAKWMPGAINYVAHNGIMSGLPGNRFDPNGPFSREMSIAVFDKMENSYFYTV